MSTTKWTIYCHIHIESGRRYVGLTKKTLLQRWNQHVYTASRLAKKGWSHFANAIRKYGKEAFDHEVLEVCGTLEEANAAEEKWILHFDTRNPEKGFNLTPGGSYRPARDQESLRERASKAAKKLWQIPGMRERISAAAKAHVFTEDHKRKLSESRRGRAVPAEIRKKISVAQKGKMRDPGSITRSAESRRGRKLSPELRATAVKNLRRVHSPETIAKIAAANRARPKATHCKHGHSLEDAYVTGNRRFCKPCRLRTCASYHARRRAMAKAA